MSENPRRGIFGLPLYNSVEMYFICITVIGWSALVVSRFCRLLLLGRPYGVTGGLIKCSWCFLFSTRNLRAPSADRRQTLPHDRKPTQNYKLGLKIPPPPKKKIGGQKHAKFRAVLDHFRLWSRISPELLKISKIGKLIDREQFLLRSGKQVRWTLVH